MKPYNLAYHNQKSMATYRNIDWQFTYDTWIEWWGEDIVNRGRGPNKLVMARNGDTGPYSAVNCKKITHADNVSEAQKGKSKPGLLGKINNPYGCKGKSISKETCL